MVDWILDRIEDCPEIEHVHLVTNAAYAQAFTAWAEGRGVTVHDDGTSSNETRMGAIGDIGFAVGAGGLAGEPLLVIAADNLFEFSLSAFVAFFGAHPEGSANAVHRLADPSLARLYGVVELDRDERIVSLEEKPENPSSGLISTASYIFSAEHLALVDAYLAAGNPPDPPGRFLAWLVAREPVYGFRFGEAWQDIGELSELEAADRRYRQRAGLPARASYSPEVERGETPSASSG